MEISTNDTSLLVSYTEDKIPHFEYFGKKIKSPKYFEGNQSVTQSDVGEEAPLYSERGGKNFLEPAIEVIHPDGDLNTELRFAGAEKSVSADGNVETTIVRLADKKEKFFVNLRFKAFRKENVISESAEIVNGGDADMKLRKFVSGYFCIRGRKYFLTHINGNWANEARVSEAELTRGITAIQSRKLVRTTLSENPAFMLSLDTPRNEESGEVIAGALAWSGNYKLEFEFDEFGHLNIIGGILPCEYILKKGEKFDTPELILTYSPDGAGRATRNLHDWARNYGVYAGKSPRPLLLNCWEGVTFNVNEPVMREIMDDASKLGAELFVMDDGWFGVKYPRDDERAGLGDWQVNPKKLPNGLAGLADYAASKGMKFGVWIEPEMVNPQSELANTHPDWIVGFPGRDKPQIRNQWLLDLSNPKVQDFIFGVFDGVLKSSPNISYIKWDANRHLESVGSAYIAQNEQERFYIDYVRGLYNVYARIRAKYPNVVLQACASGGGRIDYGALKYNDEVWGSDNTNPFDRLFIQYGETLFYPVKAIGAHISKTPCRNFTTSMKFRADVAMMCRLGIEMRPSDLTDDETADLKRAVETYKKIRDVVCEGDMYRLVSPYDNRNFAATAYVSKDKTRAVAFIFCINDKTTTDRPYFKIGGLDADKKYKVEEINCPSKLSPQSGKVLSGEYLMNRGVNPRFRTGALSAVFELTEVK